MSSNTKEFTVDIVVKPNSKHGEQIQLGIDGSLEVRVQQPPVDGKANQALVKILAKHFGVAKSNVSIVRGHKSKHKKIRVAV